MSQWVELGPGRAASATIFPAAAGELEGQLAGFLVTHPRGGVEGAEPCEPNGSWIPVHDQGVGWTVESLEPLTLSPSLLCTICGDHGWVRGGRWVRA